MRPQPAFSRHGHHRICRTPRLQFMAAGVDHTTVGIEVRDRLAFADAEMPSALERLTDPIGGMFEQAAILSTCNRVELYGIARSSPSERQLASFLAGSHELPASRVAPMLSIYRGDEVAFHLAATASGMCSLVLGEAQILGQIRTALEHALAAGTAGPELRRLFESSIAAGRKVRSGTSIGRGALSIPAASVELARRRRGTLAQSTVLLLGTGRAAQLAAQQLIKRDVGRLLVLSRTPSRAREFARAHGGHAILQERLDGALTCADVVITATGAPLRVLRHDQVQRALARRRADSTPLLVIDLSVPRAVEPSAADLEGLELHTVDDLRDVVERALVQRRAALPAAYEILRGEVARFVTWCDRRQAAQDGHLPAARGSAGKPGG